MPTPDTPGPRDETDYLHALRRRGIDRVERVRFRPNRRTIWSLTRGGRSLNLHEAYRRAPERVVGAVVELVDHLLQGRRGTEAYRTAVRRVREWPGLGEGLREARRAHRSRGAGRRRRSRASRSVRPGPCCATPDQLSWLRGAYREANARRFGGILPDGLHLRVSRRMTRRLGHMRGTTDLGWGRFRSAGSSGRRVIEIALSLDLFLPGNEDELRDTLLHEMAHAADWLRDGGRGHGAGWRAWARAAGCSPRATCSGDLRRRSGKDPVTGAPPPLEL